jgi:hypothetical protein
MLTGKEGEKRGVWRVETRQIDLGRWHFFEDETYVDALAGVVGFAGVVDHDAEDEDPTEEICS